MARCFDTAKHHSYHILCLPRLSVLPECFRRHRRMMLPESWRAHPQRAHAHPQRAHAHPQRVHAHPQRAHARAR
eukprot:116648-Pleurochrysis_carterae.AAC.1